MLSVQHSSPAIASSKPFRATPPALVVALTCLLVACGGGGGDGGGPAATTPPPPAGTTAKTMATAVSEATGTNCPYGGAKVTAGVDANTNGVLDPSEVTSVQYVCNGAPGANALTSLVRVVAEPAGANCATGGSKVLVGVDANSDGALGDAEVTSTSYVCGGANGTNGTNGSNGVNGTNGTNGTNGADGLTSLIAITAEPAGVNCQYGGSKITAGLDTNNNSILDAGEVTATNYTCNPPPAGLTWLDAPVSTTAVPNRGYFASGTSRVVITLPTTAAPGDVIGVTGTGTGGWTIAQGTGQQVMVRGLPLKLQTKLDAKEWMGVASSADGSKLIAAAWNDRLYVSTDYGETWTPRDSARMWNTVAISGDGSTMLAGEGNGGMLIWRSTDGGVTWLPTASPTGSWHAMALTYNGSQAFAVHGSPVVWKSLDGGVTWYDSFYAGLGLGSIAASADGSRLVASGGSGNTAIYTSSNGGLTWTGRLTLMNVLLPHVSISADGNKMLLLTSSTWVSDDSGVNWITRAPSANRGAVSANGKSMVVIGPNDNRGLISTSLDGGVNWAPLVTSTLKAEVLAVSADGNRAVFAAKKSPLVITRLSQTTTGTSGQIDGEQFDAVELQYIGAGTYIVRGHSSASGFTVR